MFCDFLMVMWVGLYCVIVAFPDHTHFFIMFVSLIRSSLKCIMNKCSRHKKQTIFSGHWGGGGGGGQDKG